MEGVIHDVCRRIKGDECSKQSLMLTDIKTSFHCVTRIFHLNPLSCLSITIHSAYSRPPKYIWFLFRVIFTTLHLATRFLSLRSIAKGRAPTSWSICICSSKNEMSNLQHTPPRHQSAAPEEEDVTMPVPLAVATPPSWRDCVVSLEMTVVAKRKACNVARLRSVRSKMRRYVWWTIFRQWTFQY